MASGVNLGFSYSGRELVGDDFTSDDAGNISVGSKAFIMSLCDKLGIKKNICSAKDVKISLSETDKEAMIIAINSASKRRNGVISLNRDYAEVHVVYGSCEAEVNGRELKFTLEADKSAVLRLQV